MARAIDLDKAIEIIEEKQKELCPVGNYGRHYVYDSDREKYDAWEEIIDALNALSTLTPPNEELTLEQLRGMDGEPVYVVPANEYSELGKWCVVSIGDSDDYSCALVPGVEYWSWKFEDYGEQWLAYRRPPEGEDGDATRG